MDIGDPVEYLLLEEFAVMDIDDDNHIDGHCRLTRSSGRFELVSAHSSTFSTTNRATSSVDMTSQTPSQAKTRYESVKERTWIKRSGTAMIACSSVPRSSWPCIQSLQTNVNTPIDCCQRASPCEELLLDHSICHGLVVEAFVSTIVQSKDDCHNRQPHIVGE